MDGIDVKSIPIGALFTDAQLRAAALIWKQDGDHFHQRALGEIVLPAMDNINKVTGQTNDAHYFAYVLESAMLEVERG